MLSFLEDIFNRIKFLIHTELLSNKSHYFLNNGLKCDFGKNSKIILKGNLRVGYPLPGTIAYSAKSNTVIALGKGARLEIYGDVILAPGTCIRVKDDATLTLKGRNLIGHDSLIICSKKISIGLNSSISWNVTLIDDDGHDFYNSEGKKLRRFIKPLIIGDGVGVQMNVVIPRGLSIGHNCIISACTILRRDVAENTLVYSNNILKVKSNVRSGLSK